MATEREHATPVAERPGALSYSKTVSESDVYLFAGVTGDFSPVHVNASYAAAQPALGERVAHGALLLGLMSATSARWCEREGVDALSYGYDRLRFVRPVRFGDTITVSVAPDRELADVGRIETVVEAVNQDGVVVGAARHILWRMPQA